MKKNFFLAFSFILISGTLSSQDFRTSKYIYWQPEVRFEATDFLGIPDSTQTSTCKKLWIKSIPWFQIQVAMDVPTNNRDNKIAKERVYIAPVFCIEKSIKVGVRSKEMEYAKVQFDMAEWCARNTRKKIREIQESIKVRGIISDTLPALIDEMYLSMNNLLNAFSEQVLKKKQDGAYEKWRNQCDYLLRQNLKFSTKEEDCLRFINDTTLLKNYKEKFKLLEK